MLLGQQKAVLNEINDSDEEKKKENDSIFLPSSEFSVHLHASSSDQENARLLIIDCGSPFRYNERRIAQSFHLNINDRLSRKRLVSRGLSNFLDASQLERLNQCEMILLYDDSIRPSTCSVAAAANQPYQVSAAMQCLFEQIQRYDPTKLIYILQSTFDEFFHQYPQYCHLIASERPTTSNESLSPSPSIDFDSCLMSEVIPGLFLGNAHDAKDRSSLEQNHIEAIINISSDIPCHYVQEEAWEYLQLHCEDSHREDLLPHFDKTFDFIHQRLTSAEKKKNVLLHCHAGISRSPTFVIGYLMKFHKKTFEQAYALVKSRRSIINPNWNFLNQLTRYDQMLKKNSC